MVMPRCGASNSSADFFCSSDSALHSGAMAQRSGGQTLGQRLDAQEQWLTVRLDGTRALKAAFAPLWNALSDEQKKSADELLAPHMGMTMMAGMPGAMARMPGQMQPGPTMPQTPSR